MTDQAACTGPKVRLAAVDVWRHSCARAALRSPGFGFTR